MSGLVDRIIAYPVMFTKIVPAAIVFDAGVSSNELLKNGLVNNLQFTNIH